MKRWRRKFSHRYTQINIEDPPLEDRWEKEKKEGFGFLLITYSLRLIAVLYTEIQIKIVFRTYLLKKVFVFQPRSL